MLLCIKTQGSLFATIKEFLGISGGVVIANAGKVGDDLVGLTCTGTLKPISLTTNQGKSDEPLKCDKYQNNVSL